jgi:hypothetical protein
MSLLSTPTGRPERVYSLLSLVCSLGGRVKSSDAKEWLAPQYRSADNAQPPDVDRDDKAGERVREVFRVARDLNLLDADKDHWVSTGDLPTTRRAFARHVHIHLCELPAEHPDAVLLRAYAWCVAYAEAHGTAALVAKTAKDLAREVAAGLGRKSEGDDDKVFNTTKLSAWKDWMAFLGLGWNDLPGVTGFMPDPSRCIEEELQALIPSDSRLEAGTFLAAIAKTLPYLDGGSLFEEACKKGLSRPPVGQLSRMLSQAIRALEENAVLRCEMEGDAKNSISLFPDPLSNTNAFSHVGRLTSTSHV